MSASAEVRLLSTVLTPHCLVPPPNLAPCPPYRRLALPTPLEAVGEEVEVAALPLRQEGVAQLGHVPVHDAVLAHGVLCAHRAGERQGQPRAWPWGQAELGGCREGGDLRDTWPHSPSSWPSCLFLAFLRASSLSVSALTASKTVSVTSCCHRSEMVSGKLRYSSWSLSSSWQAGKQAGIAGQGLPATPALPPLGPSVPVP